MTNEEINIAIAEACGWTLTAMNWWYKHGEYFALPPDYCTNLNAMHEAELSHIVPMTTPCYYDTLQFIIFRDKGIEDKSPEVFSAWLTHATAHQRAEALLKTLNLWKQ